MAITVTKEEDGTFRFSGRAFATIAAKNVVLDEYGCIVHDYGTVLALRPDEEQAAALNQQIGNARFVRNRYLSDRIGYYKETGKALSVSEYKKKLAAQVRKGIRISASVR